MIRSLGRRRPARVLLGPIEIAGYYASLADGLRAAGLVAFSLDLEGNPFRYGSNHRGGPIFVRLARRLAAEIRNRQEQAIRRRLLKLVRLVSIAFVLGWAVARYDVFVFSFGQTLLGTRELPLLRRLGKRIVFVFHGSDARPPYIDGTRMAPDRALSIRDCIELTARTKKVIRRIERYSDVVVAQPAFSHFFERPVVNFFVVGVPWRDRPASAEPSQRGSPKVRILHSPSDPTVKGSARIREIVGQLVTEGLPLDLVELRDVPNEVVLQELANCDFAIDQIYSDAPMVGFATEAAVAGKPTIVGGYAWPENHRIFGDLPMPPVEECAPEDLAVAIRHLATDSERRLTLGTAAHAYVVGTWSREAIARRFLTLIEGQPPAEWKFDPSGLRYLEGCGLTREAARVNVQAVLRAGGSAALCLSDKPELEALFVEFARA